VSRNIYVPLPLPTREALFQLAEQEWRSPKDQAALLLTEALRARGALSDDTNPSVASRSSVAVQRGGGV
jgi:hypothetical protein